jgi:hypothetical protein
MRFVACCAPMQTPRQSKAARVADAAEKRVRRVRAPLMLRIVTPRLSSATLCRRSALSALHRLSALSALQRLSCALSRPRPQKYATQGHREGQRAGAGREREGEGEKRMEGWSGGGQRETSQFLWSSHTVLVRVVWIPPAVAASLRSMAWHHAVRCDVTSFATCPPPPPTPSQAHCHTHTGGRRGACRCVRSGQHSMLPPRA